MQFARRERIEMHDTMHLVHLRAARVDHSRFRGGARASRPPRVVYRRDAE